MGIVVYGNKMKIYGETYNYLIISDTFAHGYTYKIDVYILGNVNFTRNF